VQSWIADDLDVSRRTCGSAGKPKVSFAAQILLPLKVGEFHTKFNEIASRAGLSDIRAIRRRRCRERPASGCNRDGGGKHNQRAPEPLLDLSIRLRIWGLAVRIRPGAPAKPYKCLRKPAIRAANLTCLAVVIRENKGTGLSCYIAFTRRAAIGNWRFRDPSSLARDPSQQRT
jgi:hypothetical protein